MENQDFMPEVPEQATNEISNANASSAQNVDFGVDNIVVVSGNKENKGAKLPIIIAACVLAAVVVIAGIIFFTNKNGKNVPTGDETSTSESDNAIVSREDEWIHELMTEEITDENGIAVDREQYIEDLKNKADEATTKFSPNVGVTSPNAIVENSTNPNQNNNENPENTDNGINQAELDSALKQVEAFLNRSCYVQGQSYSGKTGEPLAMSFDGENFDMFTNLDGTEVSIMKLDGVLYFKRPATMQYVELTPSVMDMMGLDPDELSFDFGDANYDTLKDKIVSTASVKINGEDGICIVLKNTNTVFKFYSLDGKLKQIDTCDSNGNVDMQICIDYFSTSIPGDQMTLKGYTKTSIGAIFADLL